MELYSVRHENEDELRTNIIFLSPNEYTSLKKCTSSKSMEQNITFTIQRDDSSHASFIRYKRLDNGKDETFVLNGRYSDKTIVTYDGDSLTCTGDTCDQLDIGQPVRAFVYEIDFNPRCGEAAGNNWVRNQYTVSAQYYGVAKECKGIVRY
jgi:hypothetical protein